MTARSNKKRPSRSSGRPKGQTRYQTIECILDSVLAILDEDGFEGATFEAVARKSGVSRSLLSHYFVDRQGLFEAVIGCVLEKFSASINRSLEGVSAPDEMLRNYVKAHFDWASEQKGHAAALFLFFEKCLVTERFRSLNSSSVHNGLIRIERMLFGLGLESKRVPILARKFQVLLTGAVVSYLTEDSKSVRAGIGLEELVMAQVEHLISNRPLVQA